VKANKYLILIYFLFKLNKKSIYDVSVKSQNVIVPAQMNALTRHQEYRIEAER